MIKNNILFLIVSWFFLFSSNLYAASGNYFDSDNKAVKFRIIGSYFKNDAEQEKLIVAVHFKIDKGWKIYGPDKSGFGQPPTFDFTNSTNIDNKLSKIHWPKAKKIDEKIGSEIIEYAVYEDEIVIPIEIEAQDLSLATNVNINLMFGLCKDVCIPVMQKLTLTLPPAQRDPDVLNLIQNYWPEKIFNQDVLVKDLDFDSSKLPNSNDNISNISLIRALLIAFIGGLILNIMPCVLPVLSIKLLSIIKHHEAKISRIKMAYFATILGIIFSFIIFAIITSILKLLGMSLGWGFQFQNPYFLIFLIFVLTIFITNLVGIFEFNFNSFLSGVIGRKISKGEDHHNIFIPNFLSGILAVMLATPCSAPFLGTAISFALSQNIAIIFLIFSFMGIGLSFPYFILILFPKAVKLFPKPGSWMIKVKQIMAGFLAATIIWLIYILSDNIGMLSSLIIAILSVLILAFFKFDLKFNLKVKFKILILIIITSLMFATPSEVREYSKIRERIYDKLWIKFDKNRIDELVKDGKIVVVDITADWCLTCKVNKILVLNSKDVVAKLKNPNVVAMRGDLTKMDQEILDFMRYYNRYAIPFNIVYGPSAPKGILASELLNKQKLLEIIDKASSKN